MAESIDKLREVVELCRKKEDRFNEIGAHRTLQATTVKMVELVQGKKMTLDVNVRSQEDLVDWNALSPETRTLLEAGWAAAEREMPRALKAGR